jgi:hypothetical protein
MQRSRLNATSAISQHLDDPLMKSALSRWSANVEHAIASLEAFMAEIPLTGAGQMAPGGI